MKMTLTYSPKDSELGSPAPDFSLPGVDGRKWSLADFRGKKALVVAFICNHCPYVQAVRGRINALARDYALRGVALVGINPNDASRYPDDSFEAMQAVARESGFVFPYLFDESQTVARDYGAVCTPDFFVYGSDLRLAYRGRLDDSWKDEKAVTRRELALALDGILTGETPSATSQVPAMGCSIKWRSH